MERNGRALLKQALGTIALGLLFIQCERGIVHEEVQDVPSSEWSVSDLKQFEWVQEDSTRTYDIFITLQHNADYPYRNLFLFVEHSENEASPGRDTLAAFLAEPTGKWTGSGSGSLISHRFPYLMNKRFERNGIIHFTVQHGMRDAELGGIERVGILIKEHVEQDGGN
jgi:gliding motility-associated lipoprotein GldH